jgi:hypothetical protein
MQNKIHCTVYNIDKKDTVHLFLYIAYALLFIIGRQEAGYFMLLLLEKLHDLPRTYISLFYPMLLFSIS